MRAKPQTERDIELGGADILHIQSETKLIIEDPYLLEAAAPIPRGGFRARGPL